MGETVFFTLTVPADHTQGARPRLHFASRAIAIPPSPPESASA